MIAALPSRRADIVLRWPFCLSISTEILQTDDYLCLIYLQKSEWEGALLISFVNGVEGTDGSTVRIEGNQ